VPANLLAGQILLEDDDQAATAYPHFLDAVRLGADQPEVVAAARVGLTTIEARQKRRMGNLQRR